MSFCFKDYGDDVPPSGNESEQNSNFLTSDAELSGDDNVLVLSQDNINDEEGDNGAPPAYEPLGEDSDDEFTMDEEEYESDSTYNKILKLLAEDWIMCENEHRVSKEATNVFFELAKKWFQKLHEAKQSAGITKATPQFVHLRRLLNKKKLPPISLEVGYKNKEDGEITIRRNLKSNPVGQFPQNQFEKLYEIASVKVS